LVEPIDPRVRPVKIAPEAGTTVSAAPAPDAELGFHPWMVPWSVSKRKVALTVVAPGPGIWKSLAVLLKTWPVGPVGGPRPSVRMATGEGGLTMVVVGRAL
jgi:hypothetical protein